MKQALLFFAVYIFFNTCQGQTIKILFDATKAETAGNADWVIDADIFNLNYNPGPGTGGGNEANAQRLPIPVQSGITVATAETYWKGGLSNWGTDCVKKGYAVETLPYNGRITYGDITNLQDLSNYKVYIICEPNILFTANEKTAILNFVSNGGGLFVVSDHNGSDRNGDGEDSPHILNDLFTNNGISTNPFGFIYDYTDFSQTTTNIPVLPSDSILHGPMGDVTKAQWSNGTSLTLNTGANATAKGIIYKTGSAFGNANVMCAFARYGLGKAVALGDSSPCDDGTGDSNDNLYNGYTGDASGNHQKLIMNATIWLAAANSGVLPVHFSSFDVRKLKNNLVYINWNADVQDIFNTSFRIQRSENGIDFKNISTIAAAKNNSQNNAYHFTDVTAVSEQEFYRIAEAENGIEKTHTPIKSVYFESGMILTVSPNPAKDNVTIIFPAAGKSELLIIQNDGVLLKKYSLLSSQKKLKINTGSMPDGLYYIQLVRDGKVVNSKTFVKQ